jgi:two-component system, OmpR family, sensor histidine kinase KdpD
MLYLLSVMLVAFRFGHGPAILSSVISVAAFDFFFVPPKFTFAVSDTQYLLTFVVMLAVALAISQLTANMRYQARVATSREQRAKSLYEMARELGGALQTEQILAIANRHLQGVFKATTAILLPDLAEKITVPIGLGGTEGGGIELDAAIAQWVFDHQQPAGFGTNTLAGSPTYYLPLKAPIRPRGVLALAASNSRLIFVPEQHRLLETFAAQIALALERVHFVEVAQGALLKIESERLRNSLLSAISHDLRTPLTALVGLASTLETDANLTERSRRELAEAVHDQALRMSHLVNNLLDMARLQSGDVQLNRQWHVLEEIVGSALRSLQHALVNHEVKVSLDPSLPMIYVDSVLIERVLCNLIENATKYTPLGSQIRVSAEAGDDELRVMVSDNGPGLPPAMIETVFNKFTRGEKESATPGVGLGLAICKAIVQAHRGRIWAENTSEGGARFTFTVRLLEPPSIPESDEPVEETAVKTHHGP